MLLTELTGMYFQAHIIHTVTIIKDRAYF